MRWKTIAILTILTILMALTTSTAGTIHQDSTNAANRITTAKESVDRALAYTGFDQSSSFSREAVRSSARMVTCTDSMTPYQYDWKIGSEAWLITFHDIIFDFPNEEFRTTEYARDFEVALDAETGQLLWAVSPFQPDRWGIDTDPWQIFSVPYGRLFGKLPIGTPVEYPQTTLFDILSQNSYISYRGHATDVAGAKEIQVLYLRKAQSSAGHSTTQKVKTRTTWAVILKSYQECELPGNGRTLCPLRGHILYDSESGKPVGHVSSQGDFPEDHIDSGPGPR